MALGRRTVLALGGAASLALGAGVMFVVGPTMGAAPDTGHPRKDLPAELRIERSERAFPLSGTVMAGDFPLDFATMTVGTESFTTDETGAFSFDNVPLGTITVSRPGFDDLEYEFDGAVSEMDLILTPKIVRAVHISSSWATSDAKFQEFIDLADATTVNALLLDAMGDDGFIDYATEVQAAVDHHMITETPYDVKKRLQQMDEAGLYSIVRVSVFANPLAVQAFPQYKLGGGFLDPGNPGSWEYPLDLAVEACTLGFDEINFDYIRYPSYTYSKTPKTMEGRVANISAFLEEAGQRLHPLGCAVSANSFGGPTMEDRDYGIGQHVEEFSAAIDVYSPMTYPELWADSPIFGISKPQYHPKEVVAAQLDAALPRVADGTVLRPWLQSSFYYPQTDWVMEQIQVAEDRGLGWIMWNSYDDPEASAIGMFPAGTTGEG
ncbi:MAG: hypothetical protein JW722_04100 [Demequinaceae bacterium]|nr:hypothetical protein [Demequinaceae bacterium]